MATRTAAELDAMPWLDRWAGGVISSAEHHLFAGPDSPPRLTRQAVAQAVQAAIDELHLTPTEADRAALIELAIPCMKQAKVRREKMQRLSRKGEPLRRRRW